MFPADLVAFTEEIPNEKKLNILWRIDNFQKYL